MKKLLHWLIKLKQSDGSATKSLRMKTEKCGGVVLALGSALPVRAHARRTAPRIKTGDGDGGIDDGGQQADAIRALEDEVTAPRVKLEALEEKVNRSPCASRSRRGSRAWRAATRRG